MWTYHKAGNMASLGRPYKDCKRLILDKVESTCNLKLSKSVDVSCSLNKLIPFLMSVMVAVRFPLKNSSIVNKIHANFDDWYGWVT